MNFLDKNGFRAALVIAVLFLAMPFMFPERVPVNDKGTAENSSQPVKSKKFLTGVYDRIGSFYGFKKTKKSALDQTLEQLKKNADAVAEEKKASEESAQKSLEKTAEGASSSPAGSDAGGSSFDTGSSSSKLSFSAAAAKAGAKPRLSIGGKDYEVVKDFYGNDYAITDKGPVAVKALMAKGGVLKYPSGKQQASARVSSQAYNPGGGANPYASSLTASSKSSGGSYKAGKRSGGVASTRKIPSGFSLSSSSGGGSAGGKVVRKSSGASGYGGDFTGAVDIEEAYNKVQAQAAAAKAEPQTNSFEEQVEYYDASPSQAPSPSPAPAPAIAPELLQGPSMFADAVSASAKDPDANTAVAPVPVKTTDLSLDLDDSSNSGKGKESNENTINVDISINKGTGVIPTDRNLRQAMTNELLGDNVVFESSKAGINNPWIFPTVIPTKEDNKKEFSLAFWEENKNALANAKKDKNGNSYSDPETWKKPDTVINDDVIKYVRDVKTPYKVIVVDGAATGSERNYFQQMANYITGNTPNTKVAKPIYVFKNKKEREERGQKETSTFTNSMTITPANNEEFARGIGREVKVDQVKTAAQRDLLKKQQLEKDSDNITNRKDLTVNKNIAPGPKSPIKQ